MQKGKTQNSCKFKVALTMSLSQRIITTAQQILNNISFQDLLSKRNSSSIVTENVRARS